MSQTFKKFGNIMKFLMAVAVTSGEVLVIGGMIGVTEAAAAVDEFVAVSLKGVHSLTKKAAIEIAVGAVVYWDTNTKEITLTPSATTVLAGMCVKTAEAEDSEVYVDINTALHSVAVNVPAIGATANLVGVDGTGDNAAPLVETEARLDAIEAKVDALIGSLKAAHLMSEPAV